MDINFKDQIYSEGQILQLIEKQSKSLEMQYKFSVKIWKYNEDNLANNFLINIKDDLRQQLEIQRENNDDYLEFDLQLFVQNFDQYEQGLLQSDEILEVDSMIYLNLCTASRNQDLYKKQVRLDGYQITIQNPQKSKCETLKKYYCGKGNLFEKCKNVLDNISQGRIQGGGFRDKVKKQFNKYLMQGQKNQIQKPHDIRNIAPKFINFKLGFQQNIFNDQRMLGHSSLKNTIQHYQKFQIQQEACHIYMQKIEQYSGDNIEEIKNLQAQIEEQLLGQVILSQQILGKKIYDIQNIQRKKNQ